MSKLLKFSLLSTFIFVVAAFLSAGYIVRSFKDPIDMYSADFDITKDHKGERIEGEVPFSAGQCVQMTKTTTRKGFKTTTETYYYAIPVNGDDPDYYYYICVEVKEKDVDAFNALTAHLFLGTEGSKKIEGTLTKLDDEVYDYTIDYFKEFYPEMSESEIKEYVLPICFEMENYSNAKIAILIDVVLLIVTVFLLYLFIKSTKTKKASVANVAFSGNVPVQMPVQMDSQYTDDNPNAIPETMNYNTTTNANYTNNSNTDYTNNSNIDNQNLY